MATQNVRLLYHREGKPATTIYIGPRTKSDAAVHVLQMLIPKLGMKFVFSDETGFGSFNTGQGDDVIISREQA